MRVLIPNYDHGFYKADIYEEDIVWDMKYDRYYEYSGQDLTEDEKIVRKEVAR